MPAKTKIELPDAAPQHKKVAVLAAAGLALGLAWPPIAGKHVGPPVPGAKKDADEEPAASASASAKAPKPAASTALAAATLATPEEAPAKKQSVVVDSGVIAACYHGKERIDGERCGKLKLDKWLVPTLEHLSGCPSALGLTGEMTLAFDIDFDHKAIHVRRAKRSAAPDDKGKGKLELPATTVSGIMACAADYVRDLKAEEIPHERARYTVEYGVHFFAQGAVPRAKTEEDASAGEASESDVGTVAWDTALVRDEPRTGKVVMRLVRGTRVKVLGSRKDWYEVKLGNKQGWLQRSALGR